VRNVAKRDQIFVIDANGTHLRHPVKHLPGDNFGLVQADHPSWQPVPR
jgi:hypothetical protein